MTPLIALPLLLLSWLDGCRAEPTFNCDDPAASKMLFCLPEGYNKFEMPKAESPLKVEVTIDLDEVISIDDADHSITFTSYLNFKWKDERIHLRPQFGRSMDARGGIGNANIHIPSPLDLVDYLWLPNAFIYNLKKMEVSTVLSKLAGVWIGGDKSVLYSQATTITFYCSMRFESFPLDAQSCKFQLGSYSYDDTKMVFVTGRAGYLVPKIQNSIALDYKTKISPLKKEDSTYYAGYLGNFSLAGYEMDLERYVSTYITTYYLPSGLFVILSWISFLIPAGAIAGRTTLLVVSFLVLVNISNTVAAVAPRVTSCLTALEVWMVVCILFVFAALIEWA